MKIILASASPRRRELLAQIGLDFEIRVSHTEEKTSESEPARMVEELAGQKAEAVLELTENSGEDVLVIGADTVVTLEGSILGKPADEGQAVEMLRSLSGKTHEVYTGVALLFRSGSGRETAVRRKVFHEATKVTFYPLTEEEIAA
ncbi:MAG: septum formation protein Maf, partial [Lachnospiraceae bacterium]|nr:septum formation protein Maf [Lachnospiraceae bacterium]